MEMLTPRTAIQSDPIFLPQSRKNVFLLIILTKLTNLLNQKVAQWVWGKVISTTHLKMSKQCKSCSPFLLSALSTKKCLVRSWPWPVRCSIDTLACLWTIIVRLLVRTPPVDIAGYWSIIIINCNSNNWTYFFSELPAEGLGSLKSFFLDATLIFIERQKRFFEKVIGVWNKEIKVGTLILSLSPSRVVFRCH